MSARSVLLLCSSNHWPALLCVSQAARTTLLCQPGRSDDASAAHLKAMVQMRAYSNERLRRNFPDERFGHGLRMRPARKFAPREHRERKGVSSLFWQEKKTKGFSGR